jgi:hypothetical protein
MKNRINISNNIIVDRYNYGNTRVAILHKYGFDAFYGGDDNIISMAKYAGVDIHKFDLKDEWFDRADASYEEYLANTSLPEVQRVYDAIYDYVLKNKILIVLVFWSGPLWNESFIKKIQKIAYVPCYFGDDPEGSERTSKHYVKFYDYAFCGGVYYDKQSTIAEKFLEWGAKKSKFIPLGVRKSMCTAKPKYTGRKIDLVYIGTNKLEKFFFLAALKKHFKDRMHIYGKGWNESTNGFLRVILLRTLKLIYGIPTIEPIPQKDIKKVYLNAKIGININLNYYTGPSNIRSYELPMNGVMQISDNPQGYSELYEIGKEIVTYDKRDSKHAIELIEYYLSHEKERINIAKAAYKRVQDYKTEKIFKELIEEIKKQEKYKRVSQANI